MIRYSQKLIIPLVIALLITAIFSCTPKQELQRRTQFIMGTLVEITVREMDPEIAQSAITSAFDEIRRLENLMSTHIAHSEISQLNTMAGGKASLGVSPDVLAVIRRGVYWGNQTNGALDISIGPVSSLWSFDNDNPSLPNAKRLEDATHLVNFRKIAIDESNVHLKQQGMSLQLGAIAKGYAVDRAMKVLEKNGIRHGLINAGGDLIALGERKDGQPWTIGLQHPRQPEKLSASFSLSGKAVATSGDYQKYFIQDGTRYHHILDPATGMPAKGVVSCTIIAETVMDADALATAVFVLGPEKGMALVDSVEGVEGMMITESGATLFSKNFESQPGFALHEAIEDSSR
ncbi:FAD:protein FMN transferase [hydrothermal vent metagenome]|uniref:FAD:protein FMN transferase n=1 Tax=hydrothermal vent metagenome TaxID=652676 RepID=A0A3B1DDT3_9ZZZZ